MSRNVNKVFGTPVKTKQFDTVNIENYPAFTKDIKESYVQMLMTNTLGNVFYATEDELLKESFRLHEKIFKDHPRFGGYAIMYARSEGFMRTQPLLGLVYMAGCNMVTKEFFNHVFNHVVLTPNDLIDFVTMLKSVRGNEGGRRVKDAVKTWLEKNLSEYWIIKYGAPKPGSYSLADIVRIYHPNFATYSGYDKPMVAYLLGKEAVFTAENQIFWYEMLKSAKTDADKIKAIDAGRLPHEVASTFAGSSKEVWKAIAEEMPTFALLRNLVNLERRNLIKDLLPLIKTKLTDKKTLTKAKIMPFQLYNAFERVAVPEVKDILRIGIDNTFENLPDFGDKVAIALDISGSMAGRFLIAASIFGIALAKKTGFGSKFYTFNTVAKEISISKVDSILTQAEKIFAYGGTDTSSVIRKMTAESVDADTLILITDEQQNAGAPLYAEIEKYKVRMHKPNLKVYIINVSPYAMAGLAPRDTKDYYYIYGWSDKILDFISMTQKGFSAISKVIESALSSV